MKKELRPFHDHVTCAVCGRTILKGERTEPFLAPGGDRHGVCELCFVRAEHAGWIRESAHGDTPTRGPSPQERRPLFGRLRRRVPQELTPEEPDAAPRDQGEQGEYGEPASNGEVSAPQRPRRRPYVPPQDPRHVRAVPTTAEAKIDRALDIFNASEHQRTVAGLARSLGSPWATALPDPGAPATVTLVVAWELSWYRYGVDLGDAAEPVALQAQGDEMAGIDDAFRGWNAVLDDEGRLVIGTAQQ